MTEEELQWKKEIPLEPEEPGQEVAPERIEAKEAEEKAIAEKRKRRINKEKIGESYAIFPAMLTGRGDHTGRVVDLELAPVAVLDSKLRRPILIHQIEPLRQSLVKVVHEGWRGVGPVRLRS